MILEYWADTHEIQRCADLYDDLIKCCVADAISEVLFRGMNSSLIFYVFDVPYFVSAIIVLYVHLFFFLYFLMLVKLFFWCAIFVHLMSILLPPVLSSAY